MCQRHTRPCVTNGSSIGGVLVVKIRMAIVLDRGGIAELLLQPMRISTPDIGCRERIADEPALRQQEGPVRRHGLEFDADAADVEV